MAAHDTIEALLADFPESIYDAKSTVIHEGADDGLMGYVKSGLIKGVITTQGKSAVRETALLVGRNWWFGFELFVQGPNIIRYVAANESKVALVPRQWVIENAGPEILESVIGDVSTQWAIKTSFSADKSLTIETRVLRWLMLIRQMSDQLEINLKQIDLADLAAVTRASITEPLQKLQSEGLIELHRGHFVLPELTVLREAFQARVSG